MTQMSVQMPTTSKSTIWFVLTQSTTEFHPSGPNAPTKPLMQSLRPSVVFASRSSHFNSSTSSSSPVPSSQCGSGLPGSCGSRKAKIGHPFSEKLLASRSVSATVRLTCGFSTGGARLPYPTAAKPLTSSTMTRPVRRRSDARSNYSYKTGAAWLTTLISSSIALSLFASRENTCYSANIIRRQPLDQHHDVSRERSVFPSILGGHRLDRRHHDLLGCQLSLDQNRCLRIPGLDVSRHLRDLRRYCHAWYRQSHPRAQPVRRKR